MAEQLRDLVLRSRQSHTGQQGGYAVPFSMTAERFEDIPAPLAALVDTVVDVPALRDRPADVVPLAFHCARQARGRDVGVTASAQHVLTGYSWPGNVAQLRRVVTAAARRTDVIDVQHLPSDVLSESAHHLPRIRAFERDEIVRVLSQPGTTMRRAADELGMSRATLYRKVSQYGIRMVRDDHHRG